MWIIDSEGRTRAVGELCPAGAGCEGETISGSGIAPAGSGFFAICPAAEIGAIGERLLFDASTVEEVLNTEDRIRFTGYDGYDFVSFVYLDIDRSVPGKALLSQEINLFLSKNYVVWAVPDRPGAKLSTIIETVRAQLAAVPHARTRALVTLLNAIVSDFSDMLEETEDELEAIYDQVVRGETDGSFYEIHAARKRGYHVKKYLRLTANIGPQLLLDENHWIEKRYVKMFRHIDARFKRLHALSESLYDLSNELLHAYDSKITAKTNDVVNKLTIITLFFAPLTVITGVYGMNFRFMPELAWPLGYPFALGLMAAVSFAMYIVLKRKRWI